MRPGFATFMDHREPDPRRDRAEAATTHPTPPWARMRPTRTTTWVFVIAALIALLTRPRAIIGVVLLFVVFVPLEKRFALVPRPALRRGLLTDLTHLLVNGVLVAAGTLVLVLLVGIPLFWIRSWGIVAGMPVAAALLLGLFVALLGNYVGHRLSHSVPFLWRFHAVHHSIEEMDWVASGRLHPVDAAFTGACAILPLFLLGYQRGVFAGVTVFITLLAVFQHANVRLRFPGLRWVVNTPEWHHWHHSSDPAARNKNFGLPVIDKIFGTAYLPRGRRAEAFGISDPVPEDSYLRHLAYPFTAAARRPAATAAETAA